MVTPIMLQPIVSAQDNIALAYLQGLANLEFEEESIIGKARNYHNGIQSAKLTDRMREYLNVSKDAEFRLNICREVTAAVNERLGVTGFTSDDENYRSWAWKLWQDNKMDSKSTDVHEGALRDGEHFVFVDWDDKNQRVTFLPHQRYVSVGAGGDSYGCEMVYLNNDINQPQLFAIKWWFERVDRWILRPRVTAYFPDRIEKYTNWGGAWEKIKDKDDTDWPIPWVDKDGDPIGIPIIHFKNQGMQPEAKEAIPVQDCINKELVDLMAASDMTSFRLFVALGFIPTSDGKDLKSDGSNALKVAPGQIVGTTKQGADFKAIEPADPSSLMNILDRLVQYAALVTDTPVTRFLFTKQVSSSETQKQQDSALLAKIRNRQALFGDGWEGCMKIARTIENTFGTGGLNEDANIETQWENSEIRDDQVFYNTLAIKRNTLKIPLDQIWIEAGYSQEEVDRMKESAEYKASIANMQSAVDLAGALAQSRQS
ncbi:MAG: phage portal protein [Anaerolineaceae bacterium]|nr:phage portal protein [Anaerolineaceae bacterium]